MRYLLPIQSHLGGGGVDALIDKNRRKANVKNRGEELTEDAVAPLATDYSLPMARYEQAMIFPNEAFHLTRGFGVLELSR